MRKRRPFRSAAPRTVNGPALPWDRYQCGIGTVSGIRAPPSGL